MRSVRLYIAGIHELLEGFPFLESQEFTLDERHPDAAFIKGSLYFVDGSILAFKLFIVGTGDEVVILKYGYHYTSSTGTMIFRYDNAPDPAARFCSTYPSHKHISTGIIPGGMPAFAAVLAEIAGAIQES
jgi:uncharacterized protein DUF6516